MGLRLWNLPVESDIPQKPAADRTAAQSRSSIRRIQINRRNPVTWHDASRRYNPLVALHSHEAPARFQSPPAAEPSSGAAATRSGNNNNNNSTSENSRYALREMASRPGTFDDQVVAIYSGRWAELHAASGPSPLRDDEDHELSPLPAIPTFAPDYPHRRSRIHGLTEPYAISSMRSTQAPNHPSRRSTRSPGNGGDPPRTQASGLRSFRPIEPQYLTISTPDDDFLGFGRGRGAVSSLEAAQVDGLGDRDRSVSPDGDDPWATLLTTIAPDPQPPSLGSSFASASASASASMSASAVSTAQNTQSSMTTLEEESGLLLDHACESGCDNSDTEGDEDDEDQASVLRRFSSSMRNTRQSYADSTRSPEDALEIIGGVGGLQRIMMNLARREDIPEEWWAEAGLSRVLRRETSANRE